MWRITRAVLLVLISASSSRAQAFPAGRMPSLPSGKISATGWLFDSETGSESGLGFKMPHLAFGPSFEHRVGRHFEVQGRASYSPDKKYITNDGNSFKSKATGLYWITDSLALTGSVRQSNLWTSQFDKHSWAPSAGIGIREMIAGYPGRIYLEYVFPTGCQWGTSCPIQSNRTQGAEVYWEERILPHLRLGFQLGVYHILNQGNPLLPAIPRTGQVTGDSLVILRYEFHSGSLDYRY
jgi:hypothetical protein